MTYALEEHAEADSVPVEVEIDSELIARSFVADDVKVSVVAQSSGSGADVAVTVAVDELEVASISAEVVSVLMEGVLGVIVGLLVAEEIAVRAEAPDVSQTLVLICRRVDGSAGVVVLAHPGLAVPDAGLHAVVQRFSGYLEMVSPGEGKLPALGLDLSVVASRSAGSVYAWKLRAGDDDIGIVPDVVVAGEGESVFQNIPVEADIIGGHFLPGEVVRNDARGRGVGNLATVEEHAGFVDGHGLKEGVRTDVGVAEGADVSADLEVIEPSVRPVHERLLGKSPADRGGWEEGPLLVAWEFGAAVISGGNLEDVASEQGVVDTGEGSGDGVVAVVVIEGVINSVHEFVARERIIENSLALNPEIGIDVVLYVPSSDHVEVMILAEFRSVGEDEVGRPVVSIVPPPGFV